MYRKKLLSTFQYSSIKIYRYLSDNSIDLSYEKNIAVVLQDYNSADLKEVPVPEIKENEVLVKMGFVQIGRADLQVSTIGKLRGEDLLDKHKKPIVLGSLGTGTIVTLGHNVMGDLEPGNRVVLEPRIHCGNCLACQERKFYMCNSLLHAGIPPTDGMLQKYYKHPWHLCHRLPDVVGLREGSYSTTLAYCLHAYKLSKANRDSNVAIIGGGMAGACLVKVFSYVGVKSIVVIDIFQKILGGVKNLGANYVINTYASFPPVDVVDEIVRHCQSGKKTDIVLDTVQSWATALLAAQIIKVQGTVVLFDHPSLPTSDFNYIRFMDETNNLLDIIELNSYGFEFKNAIHFLKENQDLCDYIPPYEVPLERGVEALTIARSKLSSKPCVIIECNAKQT